MDLSNLQPAVGSNKKKRRIGRGPGSGKGGTATRGSKGAKSRSGYKNKVGFEGGQMPLQRRVPKGGFKNINRIKGWTFLTFPVRQIQSFIFQKINYSIIGRFENGSKYGIVTRQEVTGYTADGLDGVAIRKRGGFWYVDHVSFGLDFKIFWLTIFKILTNADNENKGETVKK